MWRLNAKIPYSISQNLIRTLKMNHAIKEGIKIPYKIQRGPTDLLQVLESTIRYDPTSPNYKYHDDPFLTPMSINAKRTFALSRESGRKTAYWVRTQHPELFQHHECDPPIKLFFPKLQNDPSKIIEEDLINTIKTGLVSEATKVYKILIKKNIRIQEETKQNLLELLCFYNNEDALPEEFLEERWFTQKSRGRVRNIWKNNSIAEEIFNSMKDPGEEAYSALIQGMAKYHQADQAWKLFQEAHDKNLNLTTEAHNSIIKIASFLKENYELRWKLVMELLSKNIQPNLGTLNVVLEVISTMGVSSSNKNRALRVLKEFQLIGVQPSLASWYYILIIYCKQSGPTSYILKDIMQHLENKELRIQDIADTNFFVTAMDICRNHLEDYNLAIKVNELLNYSNNYNLIGDSLKESIYYRHYFILRCKMESLDKFMAFYQKFVPHVYVPESSVLEEILRSIEINDGQKYIPKIYSDMIIFNLIGVEKLAKLLINIVEASLNISLNEEELTRLDLSCFTKEY